MANMPLILQLENRYNGVPFKAFVDANGVDVPTTETLETLDRTPNVSPADNV